MESWLPYAWAGLLVLGVFMYVLLDGFDLGIGILFPFAPEDEDRDVMMNSVAPVWDGNETWLVLGGGGLFAAFPRAYAALMPAVYMPIGFMLVGLIFRGVAFEFRFKAKGAVRRFWDQAFHWGSIVATFAQGLVLGTLVQGIALEDGRYAGGMFDWLTPFSFFTGTALVWGYMLLGAGWMIIKTEHELADWARRAGLVAGVVVVICIAVVSLWVPLLDAAAGARWGINYPDINWSRLLPLTPVPITVAVTAWVLFSSLLRPRWVYTPFVCAVVLFLLCYAGLIVTFYPFIIPYSLTITAAAAAPNAQALLLVGAAILLPLILGYTAFVYWVFRGKARATGAYH